MDWKAGMHGWLPPTLDPSQSGAKAGSSHLSPFWPSRRRSLCAILLDSTGHLHATRAILPWLRQPWYTLHYITHTHARTHTRVRARMRTRTRFENSCFSKTASRLYEVGNFHLPTRSSNVEIRTIAWGWGVLGGHSSQYWTFPLLNLGSKMGGCPPGESRCQNFKVVCTGGA